MTIVPFLMTKTDLPNDHDIQTWQQLSLSRTVSLWELTPELGNRKISKSTNIGGRLLFFVILCYAIANSVFRCARVISVFRYVIHRNCKNHFRLVLHLMLTVHVIHKPVGFQQQSHTNY